MIALLLSLVLSCPLPAKNLADHPRTIETRGTLKGYVILHRHSWSKVIPTYPRRWEPTHEPKAWP